MMQNRPKDIEWFAYIQIGVIIVGFINGLINWDALISMPGNSANQQIATQVIGYSITFALLYFIVMKASNAARWICVVLTVMGTLFIIPILFISTIPMPGGKVMPLLLSIAPLISLWFLFTPASRIWFDKKNDPNIFT